MFVKAFPNYSDNRIGHKMENVHHGDIFLLVLLRFSCFSRDFMFLFGFMCLIGEGVVIVLFKIDYLFAFFLLFLLFYLFFFLVRFYIFFSFIYIYIYFLYFFFFDYYFLFFVIYINNLLIISGFGYIFFILF